MWDLRVHIIFSTLKGTNFGRSYDLIHPSIILSNLSNLNMTKKALIEDSPFQVSLVT